MTFVLRSIDNDFSTWNKYGNRYWPPMYLIDKHGVIRHIRIGEGGYQDTELDIKALWPHVHSKCRTRRAGLF